MCDFWRELGQIYYNGDRVRGAFVLFYIDEDMSPLIFGVNVKAPDIYWGGNRVISACWKNGHPLILIKVVKECDQTAMTCRVIGTGQLNFLFATNNFLDDRID